MFEFLKKLLRFLLDFLYGLQEALVELMNQNQLLREKLQDYECRIAEYESAQKQRKKSTIKRRASSPADKDTGVPGSESCRQAQKDCVSSQSESTPKPQTLAEALAYIDKLEFEKTKKQPSNSKDSHLSPGKDVSRSKRRRKSEADRQPSGARAGHPGHTWDKRVQVTEAIPCYALFCELCGEDLSKVKQEATGEVRYEEEIPLPTPTIVRAYIRYRALCPKCGHYEKAPFPAHMQSVKYMRYGPNVYALVAYAWSYQFGSYERIPQWLSSIFTLEISEGTIWNIIQKTAQKCRPVYDKIKAAVESSAVVGCDETGIYVDGKTYWLWVWQTPIHTWITVSENRAFNTIETHFPEGLPNSVLVSDRYAAQLKTQSRAKQLCLAHLDRDLRGLLNKGNTSSTEWINAFRELLFDARKLKTTGTEPVTPAYQAQILELEKKLDVLLSVELKDGDVETFRWSMKKYRKHLLYFLYEAAVPADNNSSELAIRNAKIKMNVSFQFRCSDGALYYAIIRTIVDTCNKLGRTVFDAFQAMESGKLDEWLVLPTPAPS